MTARNPVEIDLGNLHDHPQNSHQTTERERVKIANNIRRTRQYPALVVRKLTDLSEDYPGEPGHYQILDGHQRKLIFLSLVEEGLTEFGTVLCDDWSPLTDEEALICLATLNSWGDVVPRRRAELLHSITKFTDLRDAAQILPENERQIQDAQKLLKQPVADIKRLIEQAEQPDLIIITFVVGDQKAALARFTAAAQLFGLFYGATLQRIESQEGGERGRIAVLTFQVRNAAKDRIDEALKRAGAGLPPGTKNRRGRALEELAATYLATAIEEESKVPISQLQALSLDPVDTNALPSS